MGSLWVIFITSFTITLSGALMPGPLLSATISESGTREHGWLVGPLFMLGHALLELTLLAALFLGLAPLLTSRTAFVLIAFAGGGFMIWMAWGMFQTLPTLSLETEGAKDRDTSTKIRTNLPLTGALMSLANPYWTIWWATIGLGYVLSARETGLLGVAVFFSGHILTDTLWYTLVSVGIWRGRKIMPLFLYRGLIGFCALFLTGYAGYLIVNGIKSFL
jgi:threonine/homoserine/homoserine lactone efflux protein